MKAQFPSPVVSPEVLQLAMSKTAPPLTMPTAMQSPIAQNFSAANMARLNHMGGGMRTSLFASVSNSSKETIAKTIVPSIMADAENKVQSMLANVAGNSAEHVTRTAARTLLRGAQAPQAKLVISAIGLAAELGVLSSLKKPAE